MMTTKMTLKVKAATEGIKIKANAGKHEFIIDEGKQVGGQDLGPNPLQSVLGSLAACENVTARIAAHEMNFNLEEISFEVKGTFDPRGFMGDPNIRPYFESVIVEAKVKTNESDERIKELQQKVESRCPVYTANVEMNDTWTQA